MKFFVAFALLLPLLGLAADLDKADQPQYTSGDHLVRPADYRQWVWLSSGFGMAYGPAAAGTENQDPPFDNVFVTPSSYREFLKTGTWPDKTMFALEVRSSVNKGSINQRGHFQGDVLHMEIHVKDEKRFARKWAFYAFPNAETKEATQFAQDSTCFACHEKSGALDTTFAQFYPTVREVAKQKGTLAADR